MADRGYYSGQEVLACEDAGIAAHVPKPITSNAMADGRFGKDDFVYVRRATATAARQAKCSPTTAPTVENGMRIRIYWDGRLRDLLAQVPLHAPAVERRVTRWEHEDVLDAMAARLDRGRS